jgi:signal transduction histidine kinase
MSGLPVQARKGRGQGLAIARSAIVHKQTGPSSSNSTPGLGTAFAFRLPLHETTEGA